MGTSDRFNSTPDDDGRPLPPAAVDPAALPAGVVAAGPASAPEGSPEAQAAANAMTCTRLFSEAFELELDWSPGSLALVDQVLDGFHDLYRETGTMPPEPTVPLITDYLYEVARKQHGGEYVGGDGANPVVLHIAQGTSGVVVFGREKVTGRVQNGAEDSLPFFYDGIAEALTRDGVTMLH